MSARLDSTSRPRSILPPSTPRKHTRAHSSIVQVSQARLVARRWLVHPACQLEGQHGRLWSRPAGLGRHHVEFERPPRAQRLHAQGRPVLSQSKVGFQRMEVSICARMQANNHLTAGRNRYERATGRRPKQSHSRGRLWMQWWFTESVHTYPRVHSGAHSGATNAIEKFWNLFWPDSPTIYLCLPLSRHCLVDHGRDSRRARPMIGFPSFANDVFITYLARFAEIFRSPYRSGRSKTVISRAGCSSKIDFPTLISTNSTRPGSTTYYQVCNNRQIQSRNLICEITTIFNTGNCDA